MPELHLPFFAHGGDYNPDQWLDRPDILEKDVQLMQKAGCNLMSVGIFAWAALEPEEGVFNFGWLRDVLDRLYAGGIHVLLATPSGARPAWMSMKYPEVLRVHNGQRNQHGGRHNHCFTSPVYRRFVTRINTRLAEEFGNHPAVVGWHISNEYGGDCHCELCQNAFRDWLKARYGTLDAINKAWWTAFWSKTYTDWSQLHSPEAIGESSLSGLTLDWRRFVTDQTVDFVRMETAPIRRITPDLPVAINTMGFYDGLDYTKFASVVDFVGYDSYPTWGSEKDIDVALRTSFTYDYVRGFLGKPWSLMECTPSQVNWHEICKLKRPGMHQLASVQAVAQGADTVMMFQWRKGRGGPEKFHGAVVGHDGTDQTRTFREVSDVGALLKRLTGVLGSTAPGDAALIFDQNNRWALDGAQGPMKQKDYFGVTLSHYSALKRLGINVDVIDSEKSFEGYRLIAAPYLYMVKPGVKERLTAFVENGGTLVLTAFSGQVNETDLCFEGGAPGPLRELAGVWVEETDALYPADKNRILPEQGNALGLSGEYECGFICDYLHAEKAQVAAVYGDDYNAQTPVVTVNPTGKGETWYIATRPEVRFLNDFYFALAQRTGICPETVPAEGVLFSKRVKDGKAYAFFMNFSGAPAEVVAPAGINLADGTACGGPVTLETNGFLIVEEA